MVKVVKTEGTWTHFVARMTEKQNLIDYLVIINFGHFGLLALPQILDKISEAVRGRQFKFLPAAKHAGQHVLFGLLL